MCRKYGIKSTSILRQWIKLYNQGHEDFKSHSTQEGTTMTKGRKTTQEEKVQAVLFCLNNDCDYQLTCERFEVSYQQIYTWVRKYNDYGEPGLIDRRGKQGVNSLCGEEEKATNRLRQLEVKNRRL